MIQDDSQPENEGLGDRGSSLLVGISPEDEQLQEESAKDSTTDTEANGTVVHCTDSKYFNYATCSLIFMNTVCIGLQAALIQHDGFRGVFEDVDIVFTSLYAIEVILRLYEKRLDFFTSSGWLWNVFDLSVTGMSVIDTSMQIFQENHKSGGESACRLFRILRLLRMFRMVRFLGDLEFVVMMAAKATVKLCILVFLVIFVSAIVATHLLHDDPDNSVVSEYGDLGKSMWTLLKMMTMGDSGSMNIAAKHQPGVVAFFVTYIFCACIAVISLVPAIFIALNLEARAKEQQAVQQSAEKSDEEYYLHVVEQIYDHARVSSQCREQGVSWREIEKAICSAEVMQLFDKSPPEKMVETQLCLSAIYEEAELKAPLQAPVRILRHDLLRGYEVSLRTMQARMWQMLTQQQKLIQGLVGSLSICQSEPIVGSSENNRTPTAAFIKCPRDQGVFQQTSSTQVGQGGSSMITEGNGAVILSSAPTSCDQSSSSLKLADEIPPSCQKMQTMACTTSSLSSSQLPEQIGILQHFPSLQKAGVTVDAANEAAAGKKCSSSSESQQHTAKLEEQLESHHTPHSSGFEIAQVLSTMPLARNAVHEYEALYAVDTSIKAASAVASAVVAHHNMLEAGSSADSHREQPIEAAVNLLVRALLNFTAAASRGEPMEKTSRDLYCQLASPKSPACTPCTPVGEMAAENRQNHGSNNDTTETTCTMGSQIQEETPMDAQPTSSRVQVQCSPEAVVPPAQPQKNGQIQHMSAET